MINIMERKRELPQGSYLESCDKYTCTHNIRMQHHFLNELECRCKNNEGVYQNAYLQYLNSEDCIDIVNIDGNLACKQRLLLTPLDNAKLG